MAEQTMKICLDECTWQVRLNPQGTVIGRDDDCDIVIPSNHVSRRHARIFQNATGQWCIEDLGSRNGTLVNGERVESCPVSMGDVMDIGPASLSFSSLDRQITLPVDAGPNIIIEDFGTEVFYDKPLLANCDRQPCPERFEEANRILSELTDASNVYQEVCRLLTQDPQTAAAVFRVERTTSSMSLRTLACHFGTPLKDTQELAPRHPSHLAFRVSHRLLEAVRKGARPLMSKSIFSCDTQVTISIINEHSPRAVLCVPLAQTDTGLDLLYVDVPIDDHRWGAEEMFVFVQAVARLVTQKIDP